MKPDSRQSPQASLWKALRLAPLLTALLQQTACDDPPFMAEAIEGTVVDSATGSGMPGVVVVAAWKLTRGGMEYPLPFTTLMVIEVATDQEGRFEVPAWGPRTWRHGSMSDKAPELHFFKAGYVPARRNNSIYTDGGRPRAGIPPPGRPGERSAWKGETVKLVPWGSNLDREAGVVDIFKQQMSGIGTTWPVNPQPCDWWVSLDLVHAELRRAGILFEQKRVRIIQSLPLDRHWLNHIDKTYRCIGVGPGHTKKGKR